MLSFLAGSVLPLGSEWYFLLLLANEISPVLLVSVATAGNTAGGAVTYWIGHKGREMVGHNHELPRGWLTAERVFQRYGVWSLLLSWVPVIGDVLVVMAGASGTPLRLSLILILIGKAGRYAMLAVLFYWGASQ